MLLNNKQGEFMFKEVFTTLFFTITITANFLMAEDQYNIQDIDTLQTHASEAIALNNQGQILGWYNIDGSNEGKHFFVRNRDGVFFEVPRNENGNGSEINWKYLTSDEKVYGTSNEKANSVELYMWERNNGTVKLGDLPGKEISGINDVGQVLIKSVMENENGKKIFRPVIWHNGEITKLNGIDGNAGIQSDESYGLSINNKGDVVGGSVAYLVYKNKIYKQTHAVKWSKGKTIDLHNSIPKTEQSFALAINDSDEILVSDYINRYLLKNNVLQRKISHAQQLINNSGQLYSQQFVFEKNDSILLYLPSLNEKINMDYDSIWMKILKITSVNDNKEIIAQGKTVWGEDHAVFLTPMSSN
jgi:hypothetical protein